MKLAIADPPYYGRARDWYGGRMRDAQRYPTNGGRVGHADVHPDAARWDSVAAHHDLIARLIADYDGWAVAMAHDNLRTYLPRIPASVPVRIGIWHKTQNLPGAARVINSWEPVIVRIPEGRRSSAGLAGGIFVKDHIIAKRINNGFPGAKPPEWTRWVLDMLGYDRDSDTVDDLFPGSGAVTDAII